MVSLLHEEFGAIRFVFCCLLEADLAVQINAQAAKFFAETTPDFAFGFTVDLNEAREEVSQQGVYLFGGDWAGVGNSANRHLAAVQLAILLLHFIKLLIVFGPEFAERFP